MSDWLPIESAPKDGTKIDLWYPHGIGREPNSYWHSIQAWGYDVPATDRHHPQEMDFMTRGCEPTHWMPLPNPPISGSGGDNRT